VGVIHPYDFYVSVIERRGFELDTFSVRFVRQVVTYQESNTFLREFGGGSFEIAFETQSSYQAFDGSICGKEMRVEFGIGKEST
jgi:hypothetical protein